MIFECITVVYWGVKSIAVSGAVFNGIRAVKIQCLLVLEYAAILA